MELGNGRALIPVKMTIERLGNEEEREEWEKMAEERVYKVYYKYLRER